VTEQSLKRKLTAILSADVVGYSRLMGDDEESTIRTLTDYRSAMTSLIQEHRGRVVDAPGDNVLAEFSSAVHAVTGAVEIQSLSIGLRTWAFTPLKIFLSKSAFTE
jgi:adenylate cyclase